MLFLFVLLLFLVVVVVVVVVVVFVGLLAFFIFHPVQHIIYLVTFSELNLPCVGDDYVTCSVSDRHHEGSFDWSSDGTAVSMAPS